MIWDFTSMWSHNSRCLIPCMMNTISWFKVSKVHDWLILHLVWISRRSLLAITSSISRSCNLPGTFFHIVEDNAAITVWILHLELFLMSLLKSYYFLVDALITIKHNVFAWFVVKVNNTLRSISQVDIIQAFLIYVLGIESATLNWSHRASFWRVKCLHEVLGVFSRRESFIMWVVLVQVFGQVWKVELLLKFLVALQSSKFSLSTVWLHDFLRCLAIHGCVSLWKRCSICVYLYLLLLILWRMLLLLFLLIMAMCFVILCQTGTLISSTCKMTCRRCRLLLLLNRI